MLVENNATQINIRDYGNEDKSFRRHNWTAVLYKRLGIGGRNSGIARWRLVEQSSRARADFIIPVSSMAD